jgi:predicted enzyme related to lactoylglutathione lyase
VLENDVATSLLRLLLAGLLTVTLGVAPAQAAPFDLPPLVDPPSLEHHEGKIVWADLVTPDVEAAKTFYGGLFGWTFRELEAGPKDYSLALLQGRPVAGLVRRTEPPGERHQPAWLTFLSVSDIERTKRTALANGGRQVSELQNYPRRGRQVMLADPKGAVFAILQSDSGDPPDVLANPGEWIWSALLTSDAETEAAFYQMLFDYEVFEAEEGQSSEHLVLATDAYARASCNAFPHDSAKRYPHWLNYVRVINVAETAAKARQLGGRVLVEPHPDRDGAPSAVVADPAGAPIGLLEWAEDENSPGAPK